MAAAPWDTNIPHRTSAKMGSSRSLSREAETQLCEMICSEMGVRVNEELSLLENVEFVFAVD